jgi:pimeloyl-ACP methyl ester carboxylesterase
MSALNFSESGSGLPVVLIHGFPFNQKIWDGYAESLARSFRVFTIDLPGFGKSPLLNPPFTIDDVAREVLSGLRKRQIKDPIVIGHSLGGYVALAMAKQKPDLFPALILFHSTALADTEEKKESRNKVLDFISKNGVEAFTSNFIPPLFADQQHPGIQKTREIAMDASLEAVVNYTKAMRDRNDRTDLLLDFGKPIMIISGTKDGGIPVDSIKKQAEISDKIETHFLNDAAHMGMFEKKENTLELIAEFVRKSNRP